MPWPWRRSFDIIVHILVLLPLVLLVWDITQDNLGANPVREIQLRTGKNALTLLVLSLAATPVFTIFASRQVLVLRRRLGLYAFFYASLHFLNFVGVDYGFDMSLIREDIFEKRYAVAGFAAFLLLIPLAVTSNAGWIRRLGKNWTRLHRLVYGAALLGATHFFWAARVDKREALIYGSVVFVLLLARIPALKRALARCRPGSRKRAATRP